MGCHSGRGSHLCLVRNCLGVTGDRGLQGRFGFLHAESLVGGSQAVLIPEVCRMGHVL